VIRRLLLIGSVLGAACHTPARPRFAAEPLATPVAAWIPADAVMVIAIGPGGAVDIDALAAALGVPEPGAFAPPGGVWILLDEDASSTARCEPARPDAAAALIGKGGKQSRSAGATLIELGDTITVIEGGVACAVASGAASRRARHAARLAGLGDDERLIADPAARAALAALPAGAAVVAWGPGDVIGGGVDAEGLGLTEALGALGDLAGALSIDRSKGLVVTVRPERGPIGPESKGPASIGRIAHPPAPPPLPPLPVPPRDENTDVPESAEYRVAADRLTRALFAAAEDAQAIAAREDAAAAAWVAAWGEAAITPDGGAIEVRWTPPAWPPAEVRAAADAARAAARAGLDDLRARHGARIAEAEALVAELVKIRARDVAAFDRAHP
jgi:hypothetical protein